MQYLLLIYEDEKRWANPTQAELDSEMTGYRAFGKEFNGSIKGSNALQPTGSAKTVRVRNGNAMVTDGPFAETKEQLGGYYLVEAASQEEALAMAGKIPGARAGCIEVRPIMVFG
jgi:hypothetical protein